MNQKINKDSANYSLDLARQLISFPSITPNSKGCIEYIAELLEKCGFEINILKFGPKNEEVINLYAHTKQNGKNLCFAGHIDVVPLGDIDKWLFDPFGAHIDGEKLYGRGAVDMKGAIAAMITATQRYLSKENKGQISFLLTSDEEGIAKYGTKEVVKWLQQNNVSIDFCVLGEPTYQKHFADVIQIGRRGSANFILEIKGAQGHVAYNNFVNPHIDAGKILNLLTKISIDHGSDIFPPSNLTITSIDTGNTATNIVPDKTIMRFNVRYNNLHSAESIYALLRNKIADITPDFILHLQENSPEPFISNIEDKNIQKFAKTVKKITGQKPKFTTYGGASDGRFISQMCSVVEFGLGSHKAHQINEYLYIHELENLCSVYHDFLVEFFDT